MKRSSLAVLIVTALAVMAFAGVACAGSDTIYSTLGAGGTYDSSSLDIYGGADATSFTVTGGDYTLDSITLALTNTREATDPDVSYLVLLVKDAAGAPDMSADGVIETWMTGTDVLGSQLVTLTSGETNVLTAGTTYWLVAGGMGSGLSWNLSNSGAGGTTCAMGSDSTWSTVASLPTAYSINGTPTAATPEPSSLIAILGGLGSIGGAIIRRRK